jgi:mono/diheme cytochrome c family protein
MLYSIPMRSVALLFAGAIAIPVFSQTGVAPAQAILEKHCVSCHGAARMSGLDLRERDTILKGGKRGPAIVPGKPDESTLLRAVMRQGELQMPPGKLGLAADEVATLRKWIEAGAPWNASAGASESAWWAFRKLSGAAVPAVKNAGWIRNPVDAFILAKLEEKGLHPVAAASRRTLVRRAYFDLHGLPPTPEDVEQFVNDPAPDAYEKLIDRLLASPRYGERWGRRWLDVVRYADTGGFETDVYFMNAWRYRDYVIDSFNADKPYDQFVREQIAADELWPDNLELDGSYDLPKQKQIDLAKRIGTGLYTIGPMAAEYTFFGDQFRAEWQADAVDTTGAAFLGLTLGCARCHDHKFDPISQRDYYRMAAIFAGSEDREIPIVSQMGIYEYTRYVTRLLIADQLKAKVGRMDGGKKSKRRELTPAEKDERESLLRQIGDAYVKAPMRYATANVLVHTEQVPDTHILVRGDFKQKGPKVEPGFLSALGGGSVEEPAERPFVPQRRKALALWMTSKGQALLARVMVNRIWQEHFGRGIVATANDFGRQGDAPSHPELLDWLAGQFIERGWSMKAMHRVIMLSSAYRLSSAPDAGNAKIDSENQYFWKMNRRRLEAEALRDSVLATAGTLNLKAGGPPVAVPLSEEEKEGMRDASQWPVSSDPADYTRRSVYLYVKRSFRLPMLETFDAPDASASCARRDASTVAPQALALMNSEFMSAQAARFAAALLAKHGSSPDKVVDAGWLAAFGRAPSADEKRKAVSFLSKSTLPRLCLLMFNMSEFLYVD